MISYRLLERRPQAELDLAPFLRYIFDDGTVWTEFYRNGTDYLLRFPDPADFEMSAEGTEVVAHPAEGGDLAR